MMRFQDFILSDPVLGIAYAIAGVLAATISIAKLSQNRSLDAIPTVGSQSWLGSWLDGYKFQKNALEVIQAGYEKYKSVPFKVADRYRWIVILGSRQHVEELRKAPEDALSFLEAINDSIQAKYIIGKELMDTAHHVNVIRSQLTRNLASLFPEIRDEVSVTFDEALGLRDDEWKSIPLFDTIRKVICRTSNRLFVGLPLCREPDWINISLRYTRDVVEGSNQIRHFPSFLRPLLAYFMTDVPGTTERAVNHLTPIIEERLRLQKEYGNDWAEKPNDLLSWLIDEVPQTVRRTARMLTGFVLLTNFAAIHMASNSFYQALFLLAEYPQYIQPLREEVDSIVEKEGWSKAALGKMRKIDSFLKESQRLVGTGHMSLLRKSVKDFTFSDGTFIPKGTTIGAPSRCMHHDNQYYDNARVFHPFRFSDMREEEESTKHLFISPSWEYLSFGLGKHACPGRFFAASELKTMLAHIVVSYDVKLDDKFRQKGTRNGLRITPDPAARVMFRRRIR